MSLDGEFTISDLEAAIDRQQDFGRAGESGIRAAVRANEGEEAEPVLASALTEPVDHGKMPLDGDQKDREVLEKLDPDQDPPDVTAEDPGVALTLEADTARHLIEERAANIGRLYPFVIDGDTLRLRPLTLNRRVYLFLLIASNYKYLRRGKDQDITTKGFEHLAATVSRRYLGKRVRVHVFGTGAVKGQRYHGDVTTALDKLLVDTKLEATKRWERQKVKAAKSGDRGLDIVGWIPFAAGDPPDLRLVLFGQCATGRNWEGKQFDADGAAWARTIDMGHPLTQALFVSLDLRDNTGDWEDPTAFSSKNIVFDRRRVMDLLADTKPSRRVAMSIVERFVAMRGADEL